MAIKPQPQTPPETAAPGGFGCRIFDMANPTDQEKADHPHLFPTEEIKEEDK